MTVKRPDSREEGVLAQLSPAKRGPEVPKAAGVFMEAGRNKFMFRKPQSHTPNMMHPEKELILTEDMGGYCFNNLKLYSFKLIT